MINTQEQFNINYKIYDTNGDLIAGNGITYDLEERENTLFDIRNRELNYELDVDSIIAEYEVNAVNQYTIIDFVDGEEISLTYDNAGNLLYDGKNHYDWDARNRLTSAERVDGLIKWDYTYDDQNRRVAIETFTRESTEDNFISENLTKFIYNNWLLIAETDANGSVTREYSYSDDSNGDAGVGKLIKFTDYTDKTGGLLSAESKNYFVINDNVGNITSVIDSQGNIINSYAYSPFGELIVEQEQVKLNIGFNTKYEDASGLIYYNNRYYDSDLGRFISQDPIFEEGGVNLYNFVENDPINHWDILGNLPGDSFNTIEEAARDFGLEYNDNSIQENVEYAANINRNADGTFSYTNPMVGNNESVIPPNVEANTKAQIHTHAAYSDMHDNEVFSNIDDDKDGVGDRGDIPYSEYIGLPLYLTTPSGSLQEYNPKTNMITILGGAGTVHYDINSDVIVMLMQEALENGETWEPISDFANQFIVLSL